MSITRDGLNCVDRIPWRSEWGCPIASRSGFEMTTVRPWYGAVRPPSVQTHGTDVSRTRNQAIDVRLNNNRVLSLDILGTDEQFLTHIGWQPCRVRWRG